MNGVLTIPGGTLPNIPFSSNAFFALMEAKSRAKSRIFQKALLEKGMFGSVPPGKRIERKEVVSSTLTLTLVGQRQFAVTSDPIKIELQLFHDTLSARLCYFNCLNVLSKTNRFGFQVFGRK